jgi:pimeloyl-ACP methyl ester carboxylesterase
MLSDVMKPFRIHVADEVLGDLRARLRNTRWPDQVPGIGWKQGTELEWLQHLVSCWADEFDWRSWEQRLNAFDHFRWEGVHFMHKRSASGRGLPLILTHGWPGSFLDYLDVLPMLDEFDVVIPSLPGYGFSPRPQPKPVSTIATSRNGGTNSCRTLDIPGMVRQAMISGLG